MQVWSLDWEDPPEKEMATHSSILAWKIPWTGDPGGLHSVGSQKDPIEEPSWLSNENILPPMQQHLREVKPLASDQQHVSYRAGIPNPILRIFLYHIVICARSGHPKDLKRLARAWVGGVTDVPASSPQSLPPGATWPYGSLPGGKATSFHNNQSLEWKQWSRQLSFPAFCFHCICCWDNQMFFPSDNFLFVYPGNLMPKLGCGWQEENSAG